MKTPLWLLLVLFALQAPAQNIVVNGSFESYGPPLSAWSTTESYNAGNSDPADGLLFVMLNGNLYQDLATIPGQVYQLRYAVAGWPLYQGPTTLQTYWGGTLVATTVFDTTGHSNENLGWIYVTNNVLATASTTRLWFANPAYGTTTVPDLDAISVVPADASPTACIGAPAGIVSWWKGQSNALDSASANQGTLLNGVGFTNGLIGSAFYFGGGNQCVQIPYNSSLAASNYSIETWVQPLAQISDANTQAVLFAQNNGQCQLLARPGVLGLRIALQFAVDASTSASVESSSEIPIGQFGHIAGTWDGSTLRLYINGTMDAQATPGAVPFDSTCPFYIGGIYNTNLGNCNNIGGFFNGVIDEVSYYSRALSDSEISYIFHARSLGKCAIVHPPSLTLQPVSKTVYAGSLVTFTANVVGDAPIGYQWRFNGADIVGQTTNSLSLTNVQSAKAGNYTVAAINAAGSVSSSNAVLTIPPAPSCVTVTNGLVSWWRAETNFFDGWDSNDGLLLYNFSGGLEALPFLPVAFAPGKVGQAFSITTNGVLVTDNLSLRTTNAFTIEGWVNPTSLSGSTLRTIFSKFDPPAGFTTNSSYYFGASNGSLMLKVSPNGRNSVILTSGQLLATGQWSHVAATFDGGSLRLYINGVLTAQTNHTAGIYAGSADAGIGAVPYQETAWYLPWSGYLDEISLYNRALSDGEIVDIYNADLTGKCLSAPIIAAQPQSLAIPLNEDAIFSLGVLGTKPLGYQWRFNGTNLVGRTKSKLSLEKVQSNLVGNYSVVVTNTLGRATSAPASLTLLPPLNCVTAPSGMVAWWPANNFTNDVIGTNNARPPLFGGGSVASYATGKVALCFSFSNGVLTVVNSPILNFGTAADFSIEAWCKPQPQTVGPIGIPGGYPTFSIVDKIGSEPGPIGSSITAGYSLLVYDGRLACELASRSPAGTITTYVSPNPDIRDALFHHLAFTFHRNAADGGRLFVDGQLVFSFSTAVYGTASFSNSASITIGNASATDFPGFPPGSNPFTRIDELTMYNRALSPAEVLAVFQAGTAGKCIPPPTIPVQPTNQLVQAGSTATLRVVASGFPPLLYQWAKNGMSLPSATNSTLSITNATVGDAGQYSVFVSNLGGVHISALATLTVNRPPIAGSLNAATTQNNPISIPIDKLLLYASDPDADPLTLSAVVGSSTNGGSVVRGATDVTYTPSNNYVGPDSFSYSVSDGRGGSSSALVVVQIRSAADLSGNLLPLTPIAGGFSISFAGIPGRTYTLQRAESVSGPWSNLVSVVVGPNGIGVYDDTNSPPPTAFYRTVYP